MNYKVFIDGAEGTTGLRIHEYFRNRPDIEVLQIEERLRKDPDARLAKIRQADVTFLCLPDAAAQEIAAMAPQDARLIDTSTAHRVSEEWVYGLPELCAGQREKIRESCRIANPGCHATGAILLLRPLIESGVIDPAGPVSVTSLTGYSGGGKKMIAAYEDGERQAADLRSSPGQYGITQQHKHIPEIVKMAGLAARPAFIPVVADYYSGMAVTVPLFRKDLKGSVEDIKQVYREQYHSAVVHYEEYEDGMIAGNALSGRDDMKITVAGNDERILLISVFDNLGKGASGAAIQNMNILLGLDETTGLVV